ncbi:MAG: hypothetical protein JJU02_02320 [Cryomorphaceae bacterium]|nr:hypothetical protein [Cryomorphaceae bacterium]
MKKHLTSISRITLISVLALFALSCNKDDEMHEPETTGTIIVKTDRETINDEPVANITMGLFDYSLIGSSIISVWAFDTQLMGDNKQATFNNVLPGNYFVSPIYGSNGSNLGGRRAVQVLAGETAEINW